MLRLTRRTVVGGAVPAAVAVVSACGGTSTTGESVPQPSKQPVTLTAFIGVTDVQINRFKGEIGDPYKAAHPNVTLEGVSQTTGTDGSTQAVFQKLTSQVAGGSPPDIFEAPRYPDFMISKGFIDQAMDGLVKRDKYKTDTYNPKEFQARAIYQGKVVQMPWKLGGNSFLILCNTDLFQKAGVPLPSADLAKAWTWDEWVQAAIKLTKRSGSDVSQFGHNGLAWTIGSWPLLWQSDWISADLKTITCDTTDMVECYTRLQDLHYKHQVVPLPGQATQLFGNANLFNTGKAAMQVVSTGGWATYVNATPQVSMAAVPIPKVKVSTPDVNSHAMSIIKGSKAPADAWEAIKFLIEEARLPKLTERMPARLDHLEPYIKNTTKATPGIDSKITVQVARDFVPQTLLTRHDNQDALYDTINPQLTALFANGIAPGSMLKGLKAPLQAAADKK